MDDDVNQDTTLDEYVRLLPLTHRARIEYDRLMDLRYGPSNVDIARSRGTLVPLWSA